MDKEVIYTDSTSAADGRDGLAVAAQSTLAPASVHPPNVELAITPPVEPLPPGNALLKLSAPEQDGGERGAFPLHSAPARVRKTRSAGAPFIPPYVAEQRRSILHLLIRMGELAPNITLDDKGLVTLALKSLSFIQRSPTNKTLLFQELEKANYWYGGQGHHVTLVSQQDTAIRLWLTQLLFGGTLEHWIVHTLIPQCDESELTLSKLRGKMYDQLLNLVECDASYTRDEANQLWQFLMLAHCPLLIPHDQATDALRIDSFDWHDLHAGTLFLHYASPDHLIPKDKSFAQDIGNILFILSRATGQYGHFFKLPAALHAALTSSPTQGVMFKKRPYLISHYFAARNAHLATHDRVAAFQEAIGQWRTRRQLAKDIIARHRPGLSPAEHAETLQRYLYPYAGLTARKPAHATDTPQSDLTDLPQLDEAYRQMTEKVSRSYVAQYRWLCAAGWEGLADDEQNYLRQATIHLIQLWFLQPSQRRPEWSQSEHVYRPKENIDVFKAVWGDQVRFYAAINASDGCKVRRIDKIDNHLDELMQASTVAEAGIRVSSLLQVKSEQQSLATFIDTIAHRHEEMFTGRLSEYGKLTTSNQMLHTTLVAKMPFTDCYEHRPDAEGLDCHLNTHLLMTVMGEMAASAKDDVQRRVIDAVITDIRSNLLLTKRGGDGLRIPLSDAANHGQPTAQQPPGAPTTGVDCRLDPDVEGIYSLSKAAVAHVVTMGYAISETLHDNGLLLAKMDDHAFLRPLPDAPIADLIAVAGQYKLTLPFQRISQHGIYAKVMPEMGALYGPQFMLQQRNKNRIGVIEKTSDVLDVYFMFPPSSSGASVMRAAHITLDLAGIATGDLPALQRFISLRPAMGHKYINVRKISVLLDRFLGKGQYYMLSHYDLQQNQKATSTFPASFLHQNKERMLKITDEAREAVLALKQLFAEAGFLPRDWDKSLAQSPPLPRTSPIYHYLLFALGVKPADDKIIQYAARWLCYYTERIDEEFAARPLAENVLFVAHKVRRIQPDGKPSLMGFTFCNDKYRRLLIMADSFDDANQTLPRMHLLHEASLRLASVNYLHAPIATDNGQTNERVEVYEDREDIREADLMYYNVEGQFIDRYRRALLKSDAAPGETDPAAQQRRNRAVTAMSRAAFIKRLWQDNLLRANLLMDDADTVATYIYDLGRGMRYVPEGQTRLPGDRLSQLPRKIYALIIVSGRRRKPASQTDYCVPGHCSGSISRRISTGKKG